MFRTLTSLGVGAFMLATCITLGVGSLFASEKEAIQEEQSFIIGEYFVCDVTRETFADVLVEKALGPIYQRHVDSGELNGWGWLRHNYGGRWRRLLFATGNDLDTMMAARTAILEEQQTENLEDFREFNSICGSHDDLIWVQAAGLEATTPDNLGPVSYSTYYACSQAGQERADEIVQQLFAPHINELVESGQITTWGWHSHVIGGRFRRLMTYSGMSHPELIDAVNTYSAAASAENQAMANEFDQICSSHQDYLWERVLPNPDGGD